MLGWLFGRRRPPEIPDALWQPVPARYPFIARLDSPQGARLRELAAQFLQDKEFHGARGFEVTDGMAVAIAAQAVLPLLQLAPPGSTAAAALGWYDDFVGIVVHPGEVVARRETMDDTGVVHRYSEVLAGEAMEGGPVMLNWPDVDRAGESAEQGYNVVIHEFIHKIDMRDGQPDGCPPLPHGFAGMSGTRAARDAWFAVLQPAFEAFADQVVRARRFGGEPPWLDAYAAESIDEFFCVACEAYFVNRARFAQDFAPLVALFDAFFRPPRAS
ncbi:MAG: zinc-dependent peptidase [Ramlibacter sp.]|jgi:Mlc titration factor MtfA (ptsG expression regulator)|nr:zinc-dependent peptidase [Ramlibacter sp.]